MKIRINHAKDYGLYGKKPLQVVGHTDVAAIAALCEAKGREYRVTRQVNDGGDSIVWRGANGRCYAGIELIGDDFVAIGAGQRVNFYAAMDPRLVGREING